MNLKTQDEFLKEQVLEAASEFIEETKTSLFNRFSQLHSISWLQHIDDEGNIDLTIDSVVLNENYYKSTLTREEREIIKNEIFWALETIEPKIFIDLYGSNVKVTILEDDIEINTI